MAIKTILRISQFHLKADRIVLKYHPEYHVLVDCLLTREIRRKFGIDNIQGLNDILNENNNVNKICNYIHEALNVYKNL